MPDPLKLKEELVPALELAAAESLSYLSDIDRRAVLSPQAEPALEGFGGPLPDEGSGALESLRELTELAGLAATRSSGPRFFHFVMGGGTPAALGADWLASTYDQVAYAWASSPFAARLEQVATDWLRQLFELPDEFWRRPDERRDDGEPRRAGSGAQLVGRAPRG